MMRLIPNRGALLVLALVGAVLVVVFQAWKRRVAYHTW